MTTLYCSVIAFKLIRTGFRVVLRHYSGLSLAELHQTGLRRRRVW